MDRPLTLLGEKPVIGRIRGTRIRARARFWLANAFQTQLSAELFDRDGGTLVHCRFWVRPDAIVFMTLWFAGVSVIGAFLVVGSLAGPDPATAVLAIVLWLAMTVGGYLLVRFGRYLARGERDFLIDFVGTVIGAGRE